MKEACQTCAINPKAKIKRLGALTSQADYTIALAGNPNTGKSTIFNALTGMKQHTGNWSGKTVELAQGGFLFQGEKYKIVDLPGTYSLLSTSQDEQVARDFLLFGQANLSIIVADAMRLERNLNLILQILEITPKALLCLNLIDESQRNGVHINERLLAKKIGIPVVPTSARRGQGIAELVAIAAQIIKGEIRCNPKIKAHFPTEIEQKITLLQEDLRRLYPRLPNARWVSMRLIENDPSVTQALAQGFFNQWKK